MWSKKKKKTPERGLCETEIPNLLNKDFKIKVINMFMGFQESIQDLRADFNRQKYTQKKDLKVEEYSILNEIYNRGI